MTRLRIFQGLGWRIVAFTCLVFFSGLTGIRGQTIHVSFYGETVRIAGPIDWLLAIRPPAEPFDAAFERVRTSIPEERIKGLAKELRHLQHSMRLNDYLLFDLFDKYLNRIGVKQAKRRVLASWIVLSELGYGVRLSYDENGLFLYVKSVDELPMRPYKRLEGYNLVFLTGSIAKSKGSMYAVKQENCREKKDFEFRLRQFPRFRSPLYSEETIGFTLNGKPSSVKVKLNETHLALIQKYPKMQGVLYPQVQLDSVSLECISIGLENDLAEKTELEKVQILLAFVRTAVEYIEDKVEHGINQHSYVADEILKARRGDCEESAALFFQLQKNIVKLPMLILVSPDHMTIATALPGEFPNPIEFEGRKYYVTEPTGSGEDTEIGEHGLLSEDGEFKVVASWE